MPDRSAEWGVGEWNSEPDEETWVDYSTGDPPRIGTDLSCCLLRHPKFGHFCGYVAVPPGHAAHGQGYSSDVLSGISIHGGLTYAQPNDDNGKRVNLRLPDLPGYWWVGFDCGHYYDLQPGLIATMKESGCSHSAIHGGTVYRSYDYVFAECESLATQLAALT